MVGKKVRCFDVKRVVDEFEMLSKMGFGQINIADDLFTSNKKRCIQICDEIVKRGISYTWTVFARVDTVSRELLEHLQEAGCTTLCFGVESGNQEILDRIKKGTTVEKCRRAVELCHEVGMKCLASFILGLPGETHETVRETLEFAEGLSPIYGFHILSPFPGTEVREKSEEYGLKILTDDWDKYDANQSVSETEFISASEIDGIVDEFYSEINQYIDELSTKKDNGEDLPPEDEAIVKGKKSFELMYQVIGNELIEKYHFSIDGASREEIIDDFFLYVEKNTGISSDYVRKEIGRLIESNCIIVDENRNPVIEWS